MKEDDAWELIPKQPKEEDQCLKFFINKKFHLILFILDKEEKIVYPSTNETTVATGNTIVTIAKMNLDSD